MSWTLHAYDIIGRTVLPSNEKKAFSQINLSPMSVFRHPEDQDRPDPERRVSVQRRRLALLPGLARPAPAPPLALGPGPPLPAVADLAHLSPQPGRGRRGAGDVEQGQLAAEHPAVADQGEQEGDGQPVGAAVLPGAGCAPQTSGGSAQTQQ